MSKVKSGQLTEDEYQKKIVAHLNDLHLKLKDYKPPQKSNLFIQKVSLYLFKRRKKTTNNYYTPQLYFVGGGVHHVVFSHCLLVFIFFAGLSSKHCH